VDTLSEPAQDRQVANTNPAIPQALVDSILQRDVLL